MTREDASWKNERYLPVYINYYTRELAAIREQLGLTEVHILGQFFGTLLAVEYLLTIIHCGVVPLVLSAPCLSASASLWHADQRRYIEASCRSGESTRYSVAGSTHRGLSLG